MAKQAVDAEYLSDVWMRIDSIFSEQNIAKYKVAEKCGFNRKTLINHSNMSITYFARLCEELNVSADFFLFGLEKDKEKTNVATYLPDKCYGNVSVQEVMKSVRKGTILYKENSFLINNVCGISTQKELITLADDFGLLGREDVREIIENCNNYLEGQKKIMGVYERAYINMSEKEYETYKFINSFINKYGYPPSYREIAIGVGCSLSTVACRVEKLIGMGKIGKKPNCPRSISVVG